VNASSGHATALTIGRATNTLTGSSFGSTLKNHPPLVVGKDAVDLFIGELTALWE